MFFNIILILFINYVPIAVLLNFPHLHVSVYLLLLFYSCCSHAWVFGKTFTHEFLVAYSYTEWYLQFSVMK